MDQPVTTFNLPVVTSSTNLKDLIIRTRRDYKVLNPGNVSWPCPLCDVMSERFKTCRDHVKAEHPNAHAAFGSSSLPPIQVDTASNIPSTQSSSRVVCVCGFLAKNSRGLSIHMNKHKKETLLENTPPIQPPTQNVDTVADLMKEFEMLMCKCRLQVPIIRIIPKNIRIIVCQELTRVIKDVITKDDISSWFRLLAFPYIVLNTNKSEKAGQNAIRINLQNFSKMTTTSDIIVGISMAISSSNFSSIRKTPLGSSDNNIAKIVMRKINEGDFSGAVNVLCSRDTMAETSNETFMKLKAKHPDDSSLDNLIIDDPPHFDFKQTSVDQVKIAIASFNSSSSSGIDGLRPRHLKDLQSYSSGEAGNDLLSQITKLVDFIRQGKINQAIPSTFYGAKLTALTKKNDDVRPIAVGLVWRRLASKISCNTIKKSLSDELCPIQVGFGVRGGAEAVVHSIRRFVESHHDEPMAIVKLDFDNAFNRMFRRFLLNEIKQSVPDIFPMVKQAFMSRPHLYFNHDIILSKAGIQQGDPLAPPSFCVGIKRMTHSLSSRLNTWFLDDGSIGDNLSTLLNDVQKILDFCKISGMKLNTSKCEVYFVNTSMDEEVNMFNELSSLLPGIRKVEKENLEMLGSPIFKEGIPRMLLSKMETVKYMCSRLKVIDVHPALCILRHCIAAPKFQYLLRTSQTFQFPNLLHDIDNLFHSTLEEVANTKINDLSWTQATLPVSLGGIGLRKLEDLAGPAYFSSLHQSEDLSNKILSKFNIDVMGNDRQYLA